MSEQYTGEANDRLQRSAAVIFAPSVEDLEAGGTGVVPLVEDYTADIAAEFEFTEACYAL